MATLKVRIKDKELYLRVNLFENEDEIDIDSILKIDHTKINYEILTFPVIINRLGILLADAENELKEAALDLDIWYSKKKESIRNEWDSDSERPIVRGYKYTIDQVTDAVDSDPVYLAKKKRINRLEKQKNYLNSIYWSAKSKDNKLDRLSSLVNDVNFDQDELSKFNGIEIKAKEPLIKARKTKVN